MSPETAVIKNNCVEVNTESIVDVNDDVYNNNAGFEGTEYLICTMKL